MKKHYKQAHTASSNKTHDCPHCDQKFTKKRQLRLHSFTHTNKCPECGEGFQNIKVRRMTLEPSILTTSLPFTGTAAP